MAWTAPRTWVDGEVPTATMFNAHIRDNQNVLKTTRDDVGRIKALSSAYLADLSPANVTGLATRTAGTSYTAGRSRFTGSATFRLPVGVDLFDDLGGGLRRGVWIEGDYLHAIGSDQTTERRWLGASVSTPAGALTGSWWVEGNDLHYIDASGVNRKCVSAGVVGHSDAPAVAGSVWVESFVHWVREAGGQEMPGHGDIIHTDGTLHADVHYDTPHSDVHGDHTHGDDHGDTAGGGGSHGDDAHGDESHSDAGSIPKNTHTDIPHSDVPHEDVPHNDSHTDSHTDSPHTDIAHDDGHDDHSDHGDIIHADQPTVVA